MSPHKRQADAADEGPLLWSLMNLSSDAPPITSRDMAEAAMAQIAGLTIQLDEAVALQKNEILKARAKDKEIQELGDRITKHTKRLEAWSQVDRKDWGEAKSLDLRQGSIGFKYSNRHIELLAEWTELKVISRLKALGEAIPAFRQYIRIKEELHKVCILDNSRPEIVENPKTPKEERLTPSMLRRFGVEVKRDERFYAEPRFDVVTP
jgi:phage host-nuclease inhibitor protein Gam